MLAFLTPGAWAALIGVAGGWLLGFLTDLGREEWRARRARKTAALLVYAELTSNLGAVGALRKYGVWTVERIHRSAWEGQGPAFLHGADMNRVGHLTEAYNALEDIAFFVTEDTRDFTQGEDAEFLDRVLIPLMYGGMREVGPLTGLSRDEVEKRIATSKRAMQGHS